MKRLTQMITAHNYFCSTIHNLLMLIAMPLFLLLLVLIIITYVPYISLFLVMVLSGMYTLIADYYTFNGITLKGFSLGIAATSANAERFVRDALIADKIKLFYQLSITPFLCNIFIAIKSPKSISVKFLAATLITIFINCSLVTLSMLVLRNIRSITAYFLLCMLPSAIISAINIGMTIIFKNIGSNILLSIFAFSAFIISVISSALTLVHTIKRCITNLKEN